MADDDARVNGARLLDLYDAVRAGAVEANHA